MSITESFKKVHYALRPAKQVERRILVDALFLLSETGFPVRDYQYTGMGSIHFVDFALFHKFLGIKSMLSVEISKKIENRVRFNAPYRNLVAVETGKPIGDFISKLDQDRRHLLWLDYDDILRTEMLQDVALSATALSNGSILLITVDTEPPYNKTNNNEDTQENLKERKEYFEDIASNYIQTFSIDDFKYEALPEINMHVLKKALETGLTGRYDLVYQPLFNFLYKDGHRMLTIGCMLCDKKSARRIRKSRLAITSYIRLSFDKDFFWIKVPILTRKEQIHLDAEMPCVDGWCPSEFEISPEDVSDYKKIYRFYPSYAEVLL